MDLDQAATAAKAICCVCHAKPRAAGGKLTRCLDCLQRDVEVDRQQREVLEAKAKERAKSKTPATKACRACRVVKPLSSFSKYRLAKDGQRKDCKVCVKAEKTKRRELTDAQRAADAAHRRKPHRRAVNRAAVRAWTQRNPMAARAGLGCARTPMMAGAKACSTDEGPDTLMQHLTFVDLGSLSCNARPGHTLWHGLLIRDMRVHESCRMESGHGRR